MRLPNDVARCMGSGHFEDGEYHWRDGCEHCARRLATRSIDCWMMEPPSIVVFECEYLIDTRIDK